MKMELFCLHKNRFFILLAALTFLSVLCMVQLSNAAADDKSVNSSQKPKAANPNDPNAPASASAPATHEEPENPSATKTDSPDPNHSPVKNESTNENDIFELDLSALTVINDAYRNIFTPELVTEDGRVKYSTMKRKRHDFLIAERALKQLNPAILMKGLSREERIAFWINTYNFCTIEVILRHYPIEPKWYMITYPDNSIMQVTGAWEKEFFEIQREEYNLKEIEQDFLMKRYKDPRICFALSNASVGGATLRNEPYEGNRLDVQLNDQIKKYLATNKGMRWNKENNILYLSNLFQVHKNTFLASEYATVKKFRDRKEEERVWLNFILPYLSKEEIHYLETAKYSIKFIDVDWHLNEAP